MKPKHKRKPYSRAVILGVVVAGIATLALHNWLPGLHEALYVIFFLAIMAGVTNGYVEMKAQEKIIDSDRL